MAPATPGDPERGWTSILGIGVLGGLAVGLLALHVPVLVGREYEIWDLGIAVPLVGLAAAVAYTWRWASENDIEGRYLLRIDAWFVAGTVVMALGSGFYVVAQLGQGVSLADPWYTILGWATAGGVFGLLIGRYDSERKREREQAVAARERAESLSRRLTVLNRVLRHDIRNDVNVILAKAAFLEDRTDDRDAVGVIEEKAMEMYRLSENARELEHMASADEVAPRRIDVAACLRECLDHLERAYPAAEVEADLPESAPASTYDLIESAFDNVLENAVEHNPTPTPRVEVSVGETVVDGEGYVEVRIADDGPGIPEREREVLREGRETQLEHSHGMGLWLVNWVVTESGGHMAIEASEAGGSVVSIRLRRAEADDGAGTDGPNADVAA